ncbi:MAG: hypothetical protein FWD57_07395, partial [Polyangiaceae bacterium]|nr:hypothetical protein [Polyangiaceae bacterium]
MNASSNAARTAVIWFATILSGSAALAYEIAWSRSLVVPLGNAADAATIVLAAFMIGIGIGAWIAGQWAERWAERIGSPLRAYAVVEVLLGAYALVAPGLLASLSSIQTHGAVFFRWPIAMILIAAPCLAMGASLPLLVAALTRQASSLRWQVGIAYGANTAGAAIGALATGFWGLAALGIWQSSAIAAIGSFSAAILALIANRIPVRDGISNSQSTPNAQKENKTTQKLAIATTFVMGFAVLANELIWARILTFIFGHDTYAFATMLAVVLIGLAIGGAAHRLLASRNQTTLMTWLLGAFSITSIASFWTAASLVIERGRDPFGFESTSALATSLRLELARELAFTPILVLLPCMIAGAAFPTACSIYEQGSDPNKYNSAQTVGRVTLANGVGSALGAIVTSLVMGSIIKIQPMLFAISLVAAIATAVTATVTL